MPLSSTLRINMTGLCADPTDESERYRAAMSVDGAQYFSVDAPFGGYRESDLGRENGSSGYEEYLETKLIASPA